MNTNLIYSRGDFLPAEWSVCTTLIEAVSWAPVGRVGGYMDLDGCVLVPLAVDRGRLTWIPVGRHLCRARQYRHSRASGERLPRLLPFMEGLGLSPGTCGDSFLENADRA